MVKSAIIEQIKHQHFINGVCKDSENHYIIKFSMDNNDMVVFSEYLDSIGCLYDFDKDTKKQIGINITKHCRCDIMSNWLLNNGYDQMLSFDGGKSIKFISKT